MNINKIFLEAWQSLSANKMRSILTILGIVIGVAAVIALLGIGNGAEDSILGEIESIGTNLLFIFPNDQEGLLNPKPLTLADADAIAESWAAPSVIGVAPTLVGNGEVSYAGQSVVTSIVGVTPDYEIVRNTHVDQGEFINDAYVNGQRTVVILGADVAQNLFGRSDGLVGQSVRIMSQPYKVIGVLEQKGGNAMFSEDNQVLVPLTTAQVKIFRRSTRGEVDNILISSVNTEGLSIAKSEVTEILRVRHKTPLGEDDFTIRSQEDFLKVVESVTDVLTIFLGGIAGISLLVGGIGIMNIMLVSVIERTREIGLRKALGARKRDILAQFLAESAILSLIGGLLGVMLGWGISVLVGQIAVANNTMIIPQINLDILLLALLFSAGVGLFFGLYPANRAAGLEPVEALRSE